LLAFFDRKRETVADVAAEIREEGGNDRELLIRYLVVEMRVFLAQSL